jgi:hypothetical protein
MPWFKTRRAGPVLALLAVLAFAPAPAQAKRAKVTGGQTTIAPSSASQQFLSANGITASPVSPATAGSGGTLVLPIARGRVNASTLRGFIVHRGGLKFTKGSKSLTLNHFLITNTRRGGSLYAAVPRVACTRGHRRHPARCAIRRRELRVATLSNASKSTGAGGGTVVTATLKLTAGAARAIDRVLHTQAAAAGDELGTATIAPTTS